MAIKPKPKSGSRPRAGKPATRSAPMSKARAKTGPGTATKRVTGGTASRRGDEPSRSPVDWRAVTLAEIRRLIHAADPDMVEERKWIKPSNPAGVPTWSHAGIVCTGETYKQVVKLTFARGAALDDPRGLFNSSLEGNVRRAIDIHAGEKIDARAFKALIRAAVAENLRAGAGKATKTAKARSATEAGTRDKPAARGAGSVKLLTGGNPQIAKADGDAPVQAYIAAMPGWKRAIGKRLDALIARAVPGVRKAVKWNSPFYGLEDQGWFLSFHVFTRYIKVTFFRGTLLRPVPPGGTGKDARWIDIREGDELDEDQMTAWLQQAAALPGWLA